MATADRVLQLKLISDVGDISKDMRKMEGRFKSFGRSALSWGKALTGGLVIGGIEMVSEALIQGVADFREGEDAARNLSATWKALGQDGDKLASTLDDISSTAVNLGFDDTESVRAFDRFLQQTRSTAKATRLLAAAQDIARAEGISLGAAVSVVTGLFNGSARATRRYGVEGQRGMHAVNAAMRQNRRKAEEWAKNHPIEVLSGKVGEFFEAIAGMLVIPALDEFIRWLDGTFTPKMDDAVAKVGELKAAFAGIGIDIDIPLPDMSGVTNAILSPFTAAFDAISTTMDTFTTALTGDWQGFLMNLATLATQVILGPFLLPFTIGWNLIKVGFDAMGIDIEKTITDTFNSIITFIGGVVDDVFRVAQAVGKSITDGIKAGIDLAVTAVKNVVNSIIDIWNKLDFSVNFGEFVIAEGWKNVPFIPDLPRLAIGPVSTGDLIPDIPRLAGGGIVSHPTLALIGESGREAVVPLDRGGWGDHVEVNISVAGAVVDPVGTGRAIVSALRAYEASEGALWRKGSGATRTRYG